MDLLMFHPNVADRSCESCKAWMYNHETGEQEFKHGKPIPRVPGVKLPCERAEGQPLDVRKRACAKVSPTAGLELSAKNRQAYEHYLECAAVGEFPDDPIVRRNAVIISGAIEQRKEIRQLQALGLKVRQ